MLLSGCRGQPGTTGIPAAAPNLASAVTPDIRGLRLITDPSRRPDLRTAFEERTDLLYQAIDRSLARFDRPESRRYFPFVDPPVTHAQARRSTVVMRDLLRSSASADAFVAAVRRRFDVYESVGSDGQGTVFYTAYFAPEYEGSRSRTDPVETTWRYTTATSESNCAIRSHSPACLATSPHSSGGHSSVGDPS